MSLDERYQSIISDAEKLCSERANQNPGVILGAVAQRFASLLNDIDADKPTKEIEKELRAGNFLTLP